MAEKHDFNWAWADTCCIDKTNSTELTEAINSMFLYYSRSGVCYAYLADVTSKSSLHSSSSEFARSRWYMRGWTLQELLAPQNLVFVSKDWTILVTKFELAKLMETFIPNSPPASVLQFEQDISDMSVAARMSWAARRRTTRVEDEAYCLCGLFGINMPALYGEGGNAFYRLQEEIMRISPDTSLFAWSECVTDEFPEKPIVREIISLLNPIHHLFAPSPRWFMDMSTVVSRATGSEYEKVSVIIGRVNPTEYILTLPHFSGKSDIIYDDFIRRPCVCSRDRAYRPLRPGRPVLSTSGSTNYGA